MTAKGKSLCRGKSVKNPNRCKKVTGCKVASGKTRSFCRKRHNLRHKTAKQVQTSESPRTRRRKKIYRELKKLR